MSVESRYAVRSVTRNPRRTALSVAGIGIGVALALFMETVNRGRDELFARVGATSGAGHVRIVPAGWRERRDVRMRLADPEGDLAAARAVPGVEAAAPRARAARWWWGRPSPTGSTPRSATRWSRPRWGAAAASRA